MVDGNSKGGPILRSLTRARTPGVVRASVLTASAAVLAVAAAILAPRASVAAQSHVSAAQLLSQRFGFTPSQLAAVDAGTSVAVVLPSSVDREIVVAGAVFVHATAARLVSVLQDVERLESGDGFIRTKKLSDPPRLGDFAGFQCAGRRCRGVARLPARAMRCQTRPGGVRPAREDRLVGARRGGTRQRPHPPDLARLRAGLPERRKPELAVYLDSERPQFVAREFEEMIGRVDLWPDVLTPLAKYLRGYPTAARPRLTSDFFYWSLAEFGLKPVFRINHVVVHGTGRTSGLLHVVAVKQLYASHYFHTAFEVRAVVSDGRPSGKGVYLVMLNMARSDGLTGLLGGLSSSRERRWLARRSRAGAGRHQTDG